MSLRPDNSTTSQLYSPRSFHKWSLPFSRAPPSAPVRRGARLIGHHTHTDGGGGGGGVSLLPPPPPGLTHHTHTLTLNTNLCIPPRFKSPPPTVHTGLAEYSRSFQFFRRVCEPPSHHAITLKGVGISTVVSRVICSPSGRDFKEKDLNCLSLFLFSFRLPALVLCMGLS